MAESLLQFQILLLSFVLLMECDLQQGNTEEYIDGQFTGNLGEILISFDIRLSEAYVTIHVYLPQLYLTPIEKATLLLNEPLALYATTHRYGGINSELRWIPLYWSIIKYEVEDGHKMQILY
ncbi:hypothetical protein NC653_016887 [Populus alba x Populus x berolinensis]|uniref:Uncharacterized protein n=1 Tax=Populus alba x Populus x berolinensis TaxID=444605 RepID=A0AAD6QNZ3_9ROSI|nr:hypothetical protein NC653_016887 [Populus alba x Populus x berolinensis]